MSSNILSKKILLLGLRGFSGGLSSENPIAISQDKLVQADNVLVGTAPTRRKRGGMEYYNQVATGLPATVIRGITEYWRTANLSGAPVSDLFLHQGTKVYSIDDRNTAAVDRTGGLTLSSTAVPCYQVFGSGSFQPIYFTSTVTADGYNKWDGVAATAVAVTAPVDGVGKYIFSHNGRMVMIGQDNFPFTVYMSKVYDPEDWTVPGLPTSDDATSLTLDDNGDPQGITGGVSFQNRLYIFTRKSTYEITGTDPTNFVVQRVSNGIGCVAHATIVSVPNDVIFASDRGIHSLRQLSSGRQTETTFLSRDIQRFWTGLVNASRFRQFQASYDENSNCYVISTVAGADTTNSDMLVYNIEYGAWTIWKSINSRAVSTAYLNNKKTLLIGRENGDIAFLNVSSRSDFGAQYNMHFKTGVIYADDDFSREKRFLTVTLSASTDSDATVQVSWNVDGKNGGTGNFQLTAGEDLLGTTFVLGQSVLGVGQYLPYTFTIDQYGSGIQLEFLVQSVGDVEFYGIVLEVENANPVYGSRSSN